MRGRAACSTPLVGKQAAIVSAVAGTTRDYLTAEIALAGAALELVDTAGLAASSRDEIDAVAQHAGAEQARSAVLTLVCIDGSSSPAEYAASVASLANLGGDRLVVCTKSDLPQTAVAGAPSEFAEVCVSATTGRGLDHLAEMIAARLRSAAVGEVVASTAARCRDSLARAAHALIAAVAVAEQKTHGEEWIAAEVRLALEELGQILGTIYTDDILDRIFSRFCIGK
ncbi:MAG: 50S ribosome-binding GTPase [Pirellulales bacterium]